MGEEVEQECMSMPSSSSSSSSSSINDVILAPINHMLTSPVERGVDIFIADVSRRVGRLEEEWKTYGWVGNSIPPYTTINYLLKAAGICVMSNEETQEFGLQLGLRKVVVVFVVLNMCWGEWVGVYI